MSSQCWWHLKQMSTPYIIITAVACPYCVKKTWEFILNWSGIKELKSKILCCHGLLWTVHVCIYKHAGLPWVVLGVWQPCMPANIHVDSPQEPIYTVYPTAGILHLVVCSTFCPNPNWLVKLNVLKWIKWYSPYEHRAELLRHELLGSAKHAMPPDQ